MQRHLDQFRPSEPNPLLSIKRHLGKHQLNILKKRNKGTKVQNSIIPHQGAIPRSPLGDVELPKTIKLIAGGSSVGIISFNQQGSTGNHCMEIYLTALQVKMRMIQELNLLLQKRLMMITNILHNLVIQVMMLIVQVMAMKIPDPHLTWEQTNIWSKL